MFQSFVFIRRRLIMLPDSTLQLILLQRICLAGCMWEWMSRLIAGPKFMNLIHINCISWDLKLQVKPIQNTRKITEPDKPRFVAKSWGSERISRYQHCDLSHGNINKLDLASAIFQSMEVKHTDGPTGRIQRYLGHTRENTQTVDTQTVTIITTHVCMHEM